MNKILLSLAVASASLTAIPVMAMSKKPTPEPEPVIVPAPDQIVRFIAIGDMGTGKDGQYKVAAAMKEVCDARGCDFALGLGDNIYEKGVDGKNDIQFETKFEEPYADFSMPFYMTLGNHDNTWITAGDGLNNDRGEAQVAYHYRTDRMSDKWQMPARYYQFNAPQNVDNPLVSFFSMDSTPLSGVTDADLEYNQFAYKKRQGDWLKDSIAQSNSPWKIAFAHHAYRSNGKHGNAGLYDYLLGHGLFYKNMVKDNVCDKVDMIIAGHDHDLQLLKPVDSCGKTVHMVSGAGGKSRDFGNPNRNESYWQEDNTLGFFYIEIEGDELRTTAYTVDSVSGEHTAAYNKVLQRQ